MFGWRLRQLVNKEEGAQPGQKFTKSWLQCRYHEERVHELIFHNFSSYQLGFPVRNKQFLESSSCPRYPTQVSRAQAVPVLINSSTGFLRQT